MKTRAAVLWEAPVARSTHEWNWMNFAAAVAPDSILLAFGAAIVIWREGVGGGRHAVTALFIGLALIESLVLYAFVIAFVKIKI